jgi:hypothetical protein
MYINIYVYIYIYLFINVFTGKKDLDFDQFFKIVSELDELAEEADDEEYDGEEEVYMHVHNCKYVHKYVHICSYIIYTGIHIYGRKNKCTYIHLHLCTYIYMYIHIHRRTMKMRRRLTMMTTT